MLKALYNVISLRSGGQFNPALTLAALIGGQISPVKSLFYVISQLIGSVAAGGVVKVCKY